MTFLLNAFLALAILSLCSCETSRKVMKAKPVAISSFIQHPKNMKAARDRVPFHSVYFSPDAKVRERVAEKTEIYVAPVDLSKLRPIKKPLVRFEVKKGSIDRDEDGIAEAMRLAFSKPFQEGRHPRYRWTPSPNNRSVTLELAIIELSPTSSKGNLLKTAAKVVVGPVAGLGGIFTKGNLAIEGRVSNSKTGEVVFEFSDNEADKMTFYSLRDFKAYGHANVAITQWANQFAEMTRTGADDKVKESTFFTLSPY